MAVVTFSSMAVLPGNALTLSSCLGAARRYHDWLFQQVQMSACKEGGYAPRRLTSHGDLACGDKLFLQLPDAQIWSN